MLLRLLGLLAAAAARSNVAEPPDALVPLDVHASSPHSFLDNAPPHALDQDRPLPIHTAEDLDALLDTHAEGHVSLPLNISLPGNAVSWITMLLWLPAGFGRSSSWPSVYFLHGADEAVPTKRERL